MKADAWVNSSALLGRMNFALALTAGKLKGVQVLGWHPRNGRAQPRDRSRPSRAHGEQLLAGDVSRQTHDTIAAQMQGNVCEAR